MADRSAKTQKIRVIPVSHSDPDANRDDRIKVCNVIRNTTVSVRKMLLYSTGENKKVYITRLSHKQ